LTKRIFVYMFTYKIDVELFSAGLVCERQLFSHKTTVAQSTNV